MENDILRRLLWTGLVAATGRAGERGSRNRVAAVIWVRVFEEDPPE